MLNVVKYTEDAVKGDIGVRALNDHGNYIVDHGKFMEKSWNFVFEFLWEPWGLHKLEKYLNLEGFLEKSLKIK